MTVSWSTFASEGDILSLRSAVSVIGSMLVQHCVCIFRLDLRIPGPEWVSICASIIYLEAWRSPCCSEEYLGEVERGLSLVKSEMEEDGVEAAAEAR